MTLADPTTHPATAEATLGPPEPMPPTKPERVDLEALRREAWLTLENVHAHRHAHNLAHLALALAMEVEAVRTRHSLAGRAVQEPKTPDARLVLRAAEKLESTISAMADKIGSTPDVLSRTNTRPLPLWVRGKLREILGEPGGQQPEPGNAPWPPPSKMTPEAKQAENARRADLRAKARLAKEEERAQQVDRAQQADAAKVEMLANARKGRSWSKNSS